MKPTATELQTAIINLVEELVRSQKENLEAKEKANSLEKELAESRQKLAALELRYEYLRGAADATAAVADDLLKTLVKR